MPGEIDSGRRRKPAGRKQGAALAPREDGQCARRFVAADLPFLPISVS
jgi:hypothetical protein